MVRDGQTPLRQSAAEAAAEGEQKEGELAGDEDLFGDSKDFCRQTEWKEEAVSLECGDLC